MSRLNLVRAFILLSCAVIIAGLVALSGPARESQAAPFLGCDTEGYLFKYPGGPTDVHRVDMVTGQDSLATSVPGRQINAVGYNVKDDHFYGWDDQNDVFVKISNDLNTVTEIPTITDYTGPSSGIIIGDVDENGHYWQLDGSTWHEIDLTQNPVREVDSGTPGTVPTGSGGADWAFVPETDSFYRTMNNGTDVTVWAFNRTTKAWSNVGTVPEITDVPDRVIGANYADPDGNLYASSNGSGKVWRIAVEDTPLAAVHIGTGNPSGSNDGARCALASVPTDFGDAPTGYATAIADDGPRHNVISFSALESTAPLMLGKKVDIENDGFPGADATGDDADHEGILGGEFVDDERGVKHVIATPGSSDPLSVPIYVTNSSGDPATLAGWIDLDNDGTFEAGEQVTTAVAAGFSGYKQLTFPAPPAPYSANTFARFRVFSGADSSPAATGTLPTGSASGGEVEDVLVQVGSYSASKTANPAEGIAVGPGTTVTYTITIDNTGSTALTNLKIDDDLTDVLDDATVTGTPEVTPSSAGTATISGSTLEFNGDVGISGTVTVTYAVKIKDAGTLGNTSLNNYIVAAHSANCHPVVSDGGATVSHPDCGTSHPVTTATLASTGSNVVLLLGLAVTLLGASGVMFYAYRRQTMRRIATSARLVK